MIPFYSIFGYNFTIDVASIGVMGLAFFLGFVIGASLRHSVKLFIVMLAVFAFIGLMAPSLIQSAVSTLTLVDPTKYITEILGVAGASMAITALFIGLCLGLWKG